MLWNVSLPARAAALRGKQTGREAAIMSFISVPAGIALSIWRTRNYGDIWGNKLSLCPESSVETAHNGATQENTKTRNNVMLAKSLQYHCLPVVWSWGGHSGHDITELGTYKITLETRRNTPLKTQYCEGPVGIELELRAAQFRMQMVGTKSGIISLQILSDDKGFEN